jgi:GMP reductase
MKIDNDIKLTFDDVMIIPKRSTLKSIKYSKFSWEGVPIIAANMDTIGTIQMSNVLNQFDMLTALHKFHNVQDLKNHNFNNSIITIGEGEIADYLLEADLYDKYKFLMVDVANGYRECFLQKL